MTYLFETYVYYSWPSIAFNALYATAIRSTLYVLTEKDHVSVSVFLIAYLYSIFLTETVGSGTIHIADRDEDSWNYVIFKILKITSSKMQNIYTERR